jgi:alkylhydroperoxidase/carboxymuconolactone decarboxylase family protein YurZ
MAYLTDEQRAFVAVVDLMDRGEPETAAEALLRSVEKGEVRSARVSEFVLHYSAYAGCAMATFLELCLMRGGLPALPDDSLGRLEVSRGPEVFEAVMGDRPPALDSPLMTVGVLEFAFGRVWSRPGLDLATRRVVSLSVCAVRGLTAPAARHLAAGVRLGDLSETRISALIAEFIRRERSDAARTVVDASEVAGVNGTD